MNAPLDKVYEYYTNPDNIKQAWPQDIVKESESLSDSKNEEGSEMKVKGEYMGREDEMILEVTEKEQNKRLVTQQKEGPFKSWSSRQEFNQSNGGRQGTTHIRHVIDFELPTTGKIANFLSGDQAKNKIQQGLQQAAQTVKQKLESNSVSNT
ncbi:MAG TPA: SRPBCC domain-containing protein [Nitrososphaeraceae archaeon]|nr:SRPBCC domain-containing protein [Nitrososphaeraceae archaeon]